MTLLALRYMVYDVLEITNPLAYTDEEDSLLLEKHFNYMKSLQFDDFAHWTDEDFKFYNKLSYEIDPK